MSNQLTKAQNVQHCEADPPEVLAAKVEALRASLEEELPRITRGLHDVQQRLEVMCDELQSSSDRQGGDVPDEESDRLLTRNETADRLRISTRTLSTVTAAGELRAVRIKGRVLYHPETVAAYVRRQAEGGGQ